MRQQSQAIFSIGAIMAFRMLGLFMILPIFAIAAQHLPYSTPTLVGIAIGVYGLTQACFQIPFGSLSDKIGRKPIIVIGLLLFGLGSIVAALSHSIYGIILGRAIQGGGAIGSTCLALVADLTPDENRSKSMAMVGMTIGFSFLLAIVISPVIYSHHGLSGIFWFTTILAVISIALVVFTVPKPPKLEKLAAPEDCFRQVLKNPQLLRMNFSIFVQHAVMTIMFLALPIILHHDLRLSLHQQTFFYGGILILAFFLMVPFVIIAEKKRAIKKTLIGSIIALLLSQCLLPIHLTSLTLACVSLLIFFTAFTLLESLLPSLVSKIAPINLKGTAMGIYSTSQFIGIFIGGSLGGFISTHGGLPALFALNAVLLVTWLVTTATMAKAPYHSTMIFSQPNTELTLDSLSQYLKSLPGVADLAIATGEKLIYIKADKKKISENELRNALEPVNLNKLIDETTGD